MSSKNAVDVIIDGKIFTLSGFESDAYLQKIASYINNKITDYKKDDVFRRQNRDFQHTLLEINMADDYFKAKKQADMLEADLEEKDKENYNIKHDYISLQAKNDTLNKEIDELKEKIVEYQKRLIKIEASVGGEVDDSLFNQDVEIVEEKPKRKRTTKSSTKTKATDEDTLEKPKRKRATASSSKKDEDDE